MCAPCAPKHILAPQNAPHDCLPKVPSGLHQSTLSARNQKEVFALTSTRLPRLQITTNFRQNAIPERSLLPNVIPRNTINPGTLADNLSGWEIGVLPILAAFGPGLLELISRFPVAKTKLTQFTSVYTQREQNVLQGQCTNNNRRVDTVFAMCYSVANSVIWCSRNQPLIALMSHGDVFTMMVAQRLMVATQPKVLCEPNAMCRPLGLCTILPRVALDSSVALPLAQVSREPVTLPPSCATLASKRAPLYRTEPGHLPRGAAI